MILAVYAYPYKLKAMCGLSSWGKQKKTTLSFGYVCSYMCVLLFESNILIGLSRGKN